MSKQPAFLLYKGDWKRAPELSMCSPATRGIWIDLICDMHDMKRSTITGSAALIARMCRASESEVVSALEELRLTEAAAVTHTDGVYAITCRRLNKEFQTSEARSKAVQTRYKDPTSEVTKSIQTIEDEDDNEIALEGIYSLYPRKVGRRDAIKAIGSALKRICSGEIGRKVLFGEALELLSEATAIYAKSESGNKGSYTPHPATWFNKSRYLDDKSEWERNDQNGAFKGKTESTLDAAASLIEKIESGTAAGKAEYPATGEAGGSRPSRLLG